MAMLKSACLVLLSVFLSLSSSLAHRLLLDQARDDRWSAEAPQLGTEKINTNGVGIGYGIGSGGGSGYGFGSGGGGSGYGFGSGSGGVGVGYGSGGGTGVGVGYGSGSGDQCGDEDDPSCVPCCHHVPEAPTNGAPEVPKNGAPGKQEGIRSTSESTLDPPRLAAKDELDAIAIALEPTPPDAGVENRPDAIPCPPHSAAKEDDASALELSPPDAGAGYTQEAIPYPPHVPDDTLPTPPDAGA